MSIVLALKLFLMLRQHLLLRPIDRIFLQLECVIEAKSHHDIEACAGLILPDRSITPNKFTELYSSDVYEAVRLSDVPITSNQFIALYSAGIYGVVTICAKHKFSHNFCQVNILRAFIVKRFNSLNLNRKKSR